MVTVGDVGTYINGLAFKPSDWVDDGRPIIRIQNLTDPARPYNFTTRQVPEKVIVRAGDILVSWSATLDAFRWRGREAVLNQHIFRVVPNKKLVSESYLFWALKHVIQEMWASEHTHGSTMRHINRGPFLSHPFPLPSADEQDRIVAAIESQITRLDAAVEALRCLQVHLRRYRAAVLTEVCEGGQGATNGSEQVAHLPSGWSYRSLEEVTESYLIGLDRGRAQQSDDPAAGQPYIKMNNVTLDGRVVSDDVVYVPATQGEREKYVVRENDILFNTRNSVELVGKVGLVPRPLDGALYNNNLMRIRLVAGMDPFFVSQQMCAPGFRSRLNRVKRATTSIAAVYAKDLFPLQLAAPPAAEQARISARIRTALSGVEAIEQVVERNLLRAGRFRAALLRSAFEGRLVASEQPARAPAA